MTHAPHVPPVAAADPEAAIAVLRSEGRRVSTARRLIIEALFAAAGPVSAAELAGALRIDESSVYRNLDLLESHGLVRHLHLGHGPGLYVQAGAGEAEYLFCERCQKVTVVAPEALDPVRAAIAERFGHVARFTHWAIVGTCADCTR